MEAVLNDLNPRLPKHIRPRGVHVESAAGTTVSRRFVVCPSRATPAYDSVVGVDLVIDGETFRSTGRRGEAISFPHNT